MSQTVIGLRHKICTAADNQKLRNNSWSAFFQDLFSVSDVMDMNYQKDEQRLIDYLQNSCKALTQFFKVCNDMLKNFCSVKFYHLIKKCVLK